MKTDFSINVQVNLGVTSELAAMVSAILAHRPQKLEGTLVTQGTQLKIAPEEQQPLSPKEEATSSQTTTTERGRKKKDQAPQQQEQEEAAPQDEGQALTEQKPLTAEDVRAAMHATRQRIEGEDYKENTDSESYKKYHKPLTVQFKTIAAFLGAEKPSALPNDKIADFIKQCNHLQIMQDGTIGSDCPF